jgi:hypothetical protein
MTGPHAPAPTPPGLRRGLLFLIGIGTPILAGVAMGKPLVALPAGIAGLLLSFADDAGGFSSRVRSLFFVPLGLLIGAPLGFLTTDRPLVFWTIVAVGGLAVGGAAILGRVASLAARDAAIAFAIGTVLPQPTILHGAFISGGLLAVVLARGLDHILHGPLPMLGGGKTLDKPNSASGNARFAIAYAIAAAAALWLGRTFDALHAPWVVISTLVVMQPDAPASYRRIFERVAGAFAGVAAAWLSLYTTRSEALIAALSLVIAFNIPHHINQRYWIHTGLIAWIVLLMYALSIHGDPEIWHLLEERLFDMLGGCAIGIAGTLAAHESPFLVRTNSNP